MTSPGKTRADRFFLAASLALASVIPLLGIPVYFRTDDVHWLGWAAGHADPMAAFVPAQNLFGYYRPLPTLLWWVLFRLFGFRPLGYQLVLAALAVAAVIPLHRIGRRLGGTAVAGFLAVALFHAAFFTILYYVYWFSALTFALELLLLLAALDAFTDGKELPGRPVRFAILALLAALAKQPALVIIPVVCVTLLAQRAGPRRRRLLWAAALAAGAAGLLVLTPFLVHRPEALSALPGGTLPSFLLERLGFYSGQIVRGPAGPVALGAAGAALGHRLGRRPLRTGSGVPETGRRPLPGAAGALLGVLLAMALRAVPPVPALAVWLLGVLAATAVTPAALPWLLGFAVPAAALLTVDFHVATYLLEPAAILVPAVLLWIAPWLLEAGHAADRLAGRLPAAWAPIFPAVLALALVGAGYEQVGPVVGMRQVRAVFGEAVEDLLGRLPRGAVLGSLSYEELGESYAEIRARPLARRVEQHKTMNPAQLEKFVRLRGRADLRVTSVAEAVAADGPRFLLAVNAEERNILSTRPGAVEIASWTRGPAAAALFRLEPDSSSTGGPGPP